MKHLKTFENLELPEYAIGDYVEIFYIDDNYIFKIDDVRFEKGYEPVYVCIAINYPNISDNIYEAEENEIYRKLDQYEIDAIKYNL